MTIVLCGGGSGGHITPLLAVASELRRRDKNVRLIYIGERGGKFKHIAEGSRLFDELHYVSAGKLRRYHGESLLTRVFDIKTIFLNIRDIGRLFAGLVQSYFLIKRLKVDAMLLKGGFVCVPVSFAGHLNKIPYVTHDSDALPGLSNRIAARWARYHAVALPAKYYPYPAAATKVVGVPTDERFRIYSNAEQAILREKYGIAAKAPVILVTGGSNGARRLNTAFLSVLPRLVGKHTDLHVLHQIGAGNDDQIEALSDDIKKHVTFCDFTPELFHMSAVADVVVTRAGASAMADLASQKKACVVVPHPQLTGGHQLKNAKVYAEAEAAVIVQEADIKTNEDALYDAIDQLLNDAPRRQQLGKNLHALNPETKAAHALADLLSEISR